MKGGVQERRPGNGPKRNITDSKKPPGKREDGKSDINSSSRKTQKYVTRTRILDSNGGTTILRRKRGATSPRRADGRNMPKETLKNGKRSGGNEPSKKTDKEGRRNQGKDGENKRRKASGSRSSATSPMKMVGLPKLLGRRKQTFSSTIFPGRCCTIPNPQTLSLPKL